MENVELSSRLTWAHMGDLHITSEQEPNYRDFLSIIDAMNTHLAGNIDFCVLPGDNADDGSANQYALIRAGLERLTIPVHLIPGDHDHKPGDLREFYKGLGAPLLPKALTIGRCRCLFLDVVSAGRGGPDFALGQTQLQWLERELKVASHLQERSVVFMHAYPADLAIEGEALSALLRQYGVAFVDMGHTHYNELVNDGATIYATTRSTGQIEEGPVGFSVACLNHGVVSWRFKPLRSRWPFVMITSPADYRLAPDALRCESDETTPLIVEAGVWGAHKIIASRCRINDGFWQPMNQISMSNRWVLRCQAPLQQFTLTVQAVDLTGSTATDSIVVAAPSYRAPERVADGSDADALGPWPDRHLLGTRLGPNRNGHPW